MLCIIFCSVLGLFLTCFGSNRLSRLVGLLGFWYAVIELAARG